MDKVHYLEPPKSDPKENCSDVIQVNPLSLIEMPIPVSKVLMRKKAALEAGRIVFNYRRAAGLTQDELAYIMNVDQAVIGRLEGGKVANPTLATLLAVAQACRQRLIGSHENQLPFIDDGAFAPHLVVKRVANI